MKSRFRLMRESRLGDPWTVDYWLVNDTVTSIDCIVVSRSGWVSADEHTALFEGDESNRYSDVMPGEAILIDQVHEHVESDFILILDLSLHHSAGTVGKIRLTGKGDYGRSRILPHRNSVPSA